MTLSRPIFLQSIIFAVINPLNNTFCSAWNTQVDANNDAATAKEDYNCERTVIEGTLAEIAELTGASINEIIKHL